MRWGWGGSKAPFVVDLEVSGQLHALTAILMGEGISSAHIRQEAGCGPESIWM